MALKVYKPYFGESILPDHLIAPFNDNRENTHWIAGIDPGWTSPCAVVIGKGDEDGRLHVTFADTLVHNRYAEIADVIDQHSSCGCKWLGVDPAMRAHDQQTGSSGLDWWREHGFEPAVSPLAVRARLRFVARWLGQNMLVGGITISHEAEPLHVALTKYAVRFDGCVLDGVLCEPREELATVTTPSHSHLVDAFSYLLLRYAERLASKAFGPRGLPFDHAAA